ncbi:Homogentisate phytyltransferase 2 [Morus notabilis]|uniref:Homogentisate phytyltransferase 2 n=1 Tax=Morus notabilis TaxID=981085 RepID=W9RYH6_9ROSA|nr:Homogentisate phytyltransferase 2 [Morus notabilis]
MELVIPHSSSGVQAIRTQSFNPTTKNIKSSSTSPSKYSANKLILPSFPGLIAVMLANAYNIGINQIYDVDIDRVNKPYLPIAAGDLSLKQAWFLVIFDVLVGLFILWLMKADVITTSLYCLGLLSGILYSVPPFRFKESPIATLIVIPLQGGVIQNVGILYATRSSLGLPLCCSPSIVFITTFVTLFCTVISFMKDITDVEGDLKHNIRTFPVIFGPRNVTFFGTGMLLLNYVGTIAAAIYMPQAFKRHVVLPVHLILALSLLFQVGKLENANYTKILSWAFKKNVDHHFIHVEEFEYLVKALSSTVDLLQSPLILAVADSNYRYRRLRFSLSLSPPPILVAATANWLLILKFQSSVSTSI